MNSKNVRSHLRKDDIMSRNKPFTIIVSDLNHHIRDLLYRELKEDGFNVTKAISGAEVCKSIASPHCADLIILDPDLLSFHGISLLPEMNNNTNITIIVHTFERKQVSSFQQENVYFVEKDGSSIVRIKEIAKACYVAKYARSS